MFIEEHNTRDVHLSKAPRERKQPVESRISGGVRAHAEVTGREEICTVTPSP